MELLLVEDNPDDAYIVKRTLSQIPAFSARVHEAGTLADGLRAVDSLPIDAALLDLSLPDCVGLDTFRGLRAASHRLPIIVLTGQSDDAIGLQAVKEGAQDFLIKGEITPSLLSRSITYAMERTRHELELEESVRAREVLLNEIHHRVKNNLQIISSLLNMQADSLESEEARRALTDAAERVHSMAAVHESLYRQGSLGSLDFAEYLRELGENIQQIYRADGNPSVQLNYSLNPVRLNLNQAVPAALAVNELLINAFAHAFPDRRQGEMSLVLSEAEGRATIAVADNGIGLPPDFDWQKSDTLGMELVHSLAGQLNAKLDVESGPGTRITLSFPIRTENQHHERNANTHR